MKFIPHLRFKREVDMPNVKTVCIVTIFSQVSFTYAQGFRVKGRPLPVDLDLRRFTPAVSLDQLKKNKNFPDI